MNTPTYDSMVHPPSLAQDSCFVCGSGNADGIRLSFENAKDGSVTACCIIDERFQGFDGVVHGDIVTSILDDAMANALFLRGLNCVTRELTVRFLNPTRVGMQLSVKAWVVDSRPPLYHLKGEIRQDAALTARATGSFADPAHIRRLMESIA